MITTAAFWKGAAERALKTFVQTFIAALLTMVGTIASAWDVPWLTSIWTALGLALAAAIPVLPGAMADGVDYLVDFQWNMAMRQDAVVTFIEPGGGEAQGVNCRG